MFGKSKYLVQAYTIVGVLFGLTFVATSALIDMYLRHATIGSLADLFLHNPAQWVVTTAPLVLGVIFNVIGRIQAGLQFANLIHSTAMETSPDGILVVDANAKMLSFNQRFADMWGIPSDALQKGDDAPVLAAVMSAQVDPEAFVARVRYLYAHPTLDSHDELETKDARCIDRHAAPLYSESGQYLVLPRYHGAKTGAGADPKNCPE